MSSVIIAVVVVLGIIVAGGFLLYFLGDLLMSISGKKKDVDAIREKQLKQQKELEQRVNALENSQEAKNDPQIATVLFNGGMVEAYDPNEDEETNVEETISEEVEPVQETSEETSSEEDDDTTEYIRQRRKELLERLARMQEEREEEASAEESEDTIDLTETEETPNDADGIVAEEQTEEQEEVAEESETAESTQETSEEVAEETADVEETVEETVETVEEATESVEETVSEAVEEEVAQRVEEEVADEVASEVAQDGTNSLTSNFTLEELEARLAEAQDQLKGNEKELRQCKKEFIPLRRVKNTLESDEKKLRRKEALVAKQKVVLYGVNNYADIDDEKAQKLAEDLDLLDGLKLSVQHCQEVMDKNQERYPLLEKIFNLLSSQNEQIKNDIKNLQEAIASLKGDGDQE